MKTGLCALVFILMSGVSHCQDAVALCSLSSTVPPKPMPDLMTLAPINYQLEVEYTIVNLNQTNYYREYYDQYENKGRIDILEDGETTMYYYFSDGMEAFQINDQTCSEHNESSVPEFMRGLMYEWNYNGIDKNGKKRIMHGPSAMFEYAIAAQERDSKTVRYMGNSPDIRGIPSRYWRRCLTDSLTADYFFSAPEHEDVYGVKGLKEIPLRIVIYGFDDDIPEDSKDQLPQNYEIMSFAPFLDDTLYTFELPAGMGCGRKQQKNDADLPNFEKSSLFVLAEAIYTDKSKANENSYSNNFMYAMDVASGFSSYFYAPWKGSGGSTATGDPKYVVYDMTNKYVYETNYGDASCQIKNVHNYIPQYTLPDDIGYISLTDYSIFYSTNDFYYIGEGVERGYKVNIFEVDYPDGYALGDKLVKNTVVTHYYLTDSEIKRGPVPVQNALVRIRIAFNGDTVKGKMIKGVLNLNLYAFNTQMDFKERLFDITNCFRNDDDYMMLTIGFPADDSLLKQVADKIPDIESNIRGIMTTETEITPARLPQVLVDLREGIFVTLYMLERPPVQLDFALPIQEKIVTGNVISTGIVGLQDCAFLCLENDDECWGFAHCGATCYVASGDKKQSKLESKTGCLFYERTMFDSIPRLKVVRRNLERLVETGQIKLAVEDEAKQEKFLTANSIGLAAIGETEEMFNLMGLDTNPRLRVVKLASKLKSGTGERVKNLGSVTYSECQSLCLDYKNCETVSYCISNGECVLSTTSGDEIPANAIVEDSFCNLLSRKYSDKFVRSPGNVLSQSANKTVMAATVEDCAKACAKEATFDCLSFDHCPAATDDGCRLHGVHYLDVKSDEGAVTKQPVCGHYSRKFSYDFKLQPKVKTDPTGLVVSTNVTLEECARFCEEYNNIGPCHGFDICQDEAVTATSCSLLITTRARDMNTAADPVCNHYTRDPPPRPRAMPPTGRPYSNATAGGVGFLMLVIGLFLGGLLVFGVAYFRVNKAR